MRTIAGSAAFVAALVLGWPVVLATGVVALVAVMCRPRRWAMLTLLVACAVAGDLRGSTALDDTGAPADLTGPFEGTLTTYARRSAARQRYEVETTDGARLCATSPRDLALGRGDVIRFDGEVSPVAGLPPSRAAALRHIGCGGTVDATDVRVLRQGQGLRRRLDGFRRDITEWFEATVPGDPGALLAGLVIGDDDGLSFDTRQGFYDLGMSHITAVSGSNLALLTWLLIGRGGRRRPLLVDTGTLGVLWLYVLLAGAGPSTVRAGLTATLCVIVVRTGRKPDLLTIASLVAATQVLVDPSLIGSLAYRLSTIAMLVMISTLTARPGDSWIGKVKTLVACSVAIQLATLPFVPDTDQAIVAGIVANCLAAPLVGLAFAVATAAALVRPISEAAASALATVAELPADLVLDLISALDRSALAEIRGDALDWLPQQVLRIALTGAVIVTFGRHARRAVGDLRTALIGLSAGERGVWVSLVGGAVIGVITVTVSR